MASQFSKDSKYYAHFTSEGKIKIWDVFSNTFAQEFTPDFHLTSPCTCLHFIQNDVFNNKIGPPKKKKKRDSITNIPNIVLGTSSGLLLIYSLAKADLEFTINSETNLSICCLSTCDNNKVYSGADQSIIVWDLYEKVVVSKWSSGKEKISAILIIPNTDKLLTASKNIKLWDVNSKEVLKTFTGHSSPICVLEYINIQSNDGYFISGSNNDRILSCWNLNESKTQAVVNYLMVDIVNNVSIFTANGCTNIAVTIRSGFVHIYQHTLNGRCGKPLKPKTTIQIVSENCDEKQQNDQIAPIKIFAANYINEKTLCIGYGSIVKHFETINIEFDRKYQCLLRNDPNKLNKQTIENVKSTIINNDNVNYILPISSTIKRKIDGKQEVPMEKRLENLTINKSDILVPKTDNLAQLLVQGLHSKDESIIKTVLYKQDEKLIKNTLKRFPMPVIAPLIEEITKFIKGKTLMAQCGTLWMKNLIHIHAGVLVSNPELDKLFGPIIGCIETRLSLETSLNRLKGRLDLLIAQINGVTSQENNLNEDALIVYNDKDSSESDNEDLEIDFHSESDNEWIEESDENQDAVSDESDHDDNEESMSL